MQDTCDTAPIAMLHLNVLDLIMSPRGVQTLQMEIFFFLQSFIVVTSSGDRIPPFSPFPERRIDLTTSSLSTVSSFFFRVVQTSAMTCHESDSIADGLGGAPAPEIGYGIRGEDWQRAKLRRLGGADERMRVCGDLEDVVGGRRRSG